MASTASCSTIHTQHINMWCMNCGTHLLCAHILSSSRMLMVVAMGFPKSTSLVVCGIVKGSQHISIVSEALSPLAVEAIYSLGHLGDANFVKGMYTKLIS